MTQTRPQSAPWKTNFYFTTTAHSRVTLKKQVTHLGEITGFDLKGNGGWGYVRAEAGQLKRGNIFAFFAALSRACSARFP